MILIDAGPLLALIDPADESHVRCTQAASSLPDAPLITTWPCFTEAMYLAGREGGYRLQETLWDCDGMAFSNFTNSMKTE